MAQKRKKAIRILILVITVSLLLFGFLLYSTIKMKTRNISEMQPFATYVGDKLNLQRTVWLFQEKEPVDSKYPLVLLDSLNPSFQWYHDRIKLQNPEVKLIKKITEGTSLQFDKVIMYTNGVSGTSTPRMFGELQDAGQTYRVEYSWGDQSFARMLDKEEKTWYFGLAPWQSTKDTAFYELPIAEFW